LARRRVGNEKKSPVAKLYLANRARSGAEYSEGWIDAEVDPCLAGFLLAETAKKRIELAKLFSDKVAPATELSERVRKRILRE
jgi:hypothetical protein